MVQNSHKYFTGLFCNETALGQVAVLAMIANVGPVAIIPVVAVIPVVAIASTLNDPAAFDPDVAIVPAIPAALLPPMIGELAFPMAIHPSPLAAAAVPATFDPHIARSVFCDISARWGWPFINYHDGCWPDPEIATSANHATRSGDQ